VCVTCVVPVCEFTPVICEWRVCDMCGANV